MVNVGEDIILPYIILVYVVFREADSLPYK